MSRSTAEIVREYGPFSGADSVHGVTYDGQNVWFAAGDKLNAFDPVSGKTLRSIDVAAHAVRLVAALGFAQFEQRTPELTLLNHWLDSSAGIGTVVAGMHRLGWDVQMTQYGHGHSRATFWVTGLTLSIAGGSAWEPTPWRAVQQRAGVGRDPPRRAAGMSIADDIFGQSPRGLPTVLARDPMLIAGAGIYPLELLIPAVVLVIANRCPRPLRVDDAGPRTAGPAFDPEAALAMAINVNGMVALSYALSSVLAAIGGVLIGPLIGVSSNMGFLIGLKAFAVAMVGGLEHGLPDCSRALRRAHQEVRLSLRAGSSRSAQPSGLHDVRMARPSLGADRIAEGSTPAPSRVLDPKRSTGANSCPEEPGGG